MHWLIRVELVHAYRMCASFFLLLLTILLLSSSSIWNCPAQTPDIIGYIKYNMRNINCTTCNLNQETTRVCGDMILNSSYVTHLLEGGMLKPTTNELSRCKRR